MTALITLFGLFLILAGTSLIFRPQVVFGLLNNNLENTWLYTAAIVTRLIVGALLLYFASISKYPATINAIGWILIVAAVVLAVIGRNRFRRLVSWVLSVFEPYGHVGGIVSVCFGIFLIYAFF